MYNSTNEGNKMAKKFFSNLFKKSVAPKVKGYKTVKIIETGHNASSSFSFEYSDLEVSIVKDHEGKRYLRVYKKECTAEGNGRPLTTVSDDCYPLKDVEKVTKENWKKVMLRHFSEAVRLDHESFSGV